MTDEDELRQKEREHITNLEETAYRSLLPGVEYALKCVLQELNQIRERLGMEEVTVEGLGEGWSRPKKGGLTEEGRRKLSEMMRSRWQQAYKEGKHVTELKPTKKNNSGAKKKRTIEKPYPEG